MLAPYLKGGDLLELFIILFLLLTGIFLFISAVYNKTSYGPHPIYLFFSSGSLFVSFLMIWLNLFGTPEFHLISHLLQHEKSFPFISATFIAIHVLNIVAANTLQEIRETS